MINIRTDLIQKELQSDIAKGFKYRNFKPSNIYIDRLFQNYCVLEHTEHYYDSEPDYYDEEHNMYMDYEFINKRIDPDGTAFFKAILNMDEIGEKKENFRFSEKEHTMDELEQAHKKICQQRADYEDSRIEFNNWIEPYFEENWGMSQEDVDSISRKHLEDIKKRCKGRLYIAEMANEIRIYYYGRDYAQLDYWWVFKKRTEFGRHK